MTNIKNIVSKIVKKYKTTNPFLITERRGIIVMEDTLKNIKGFHSEYCRQRFIHINKELSYTEKLFTVAHELGHIFLHPKLATPFLRNNTYLVIDRYEREANKFAAELLISDELLQGYESSEDFIANSGINIEILRIKMEG